jgi:hypothetical protein
METNTRILFRSFKLRGDAIAHRIGHGPLPDYPPPRPLSGGRSQDGGKTLVEALPARDVGGVDLAAVQRLPPFILMSSCDDVVVPW